MLPRTIGAICLGPSGNEQGGHYFMSLMTGRRILRDRWTELPMPQDAITRVGSLGRQQGMPKTLTFADRFGFELPDGDDAVDDDHDSAYAPSDDDASDDDASTISDASSASSHSDSSDSDDDPDAGDAIIAQPLPGLNAGVNDDHSDHSDSDSDGYDDDDDNIDDDNDDDNGNYDAQINEETADDDEAHIPEINIPDTVASTPPAESAGVGGPAENAGVRGVDNELTQTMDERYGVRQHDIDLRSRKPRSYDHLYGPDHLLATFEEPMGELFMTEQMSLKKGLKYFGKKGADAVVSEMRQLDYRKVIKPVKGKELTREDKRRALNYLMYLKQKRCGRIKARGCADGRKQRLYKSKDETSSPTVSTEAVFLTSVIEAQERRKVMTIDIPGAFMQADIDELIHVRLEGPMAELLTRVDPDKYRTYMCEEHGKQVLYVKLEKALYGTLQAAILFWENLTGYLIGELGFTLNPYDSCVANKVIDGDQCTIIWHVDDLKLSHTKQHVLENIAAALNSKYGKEDPLVIHRGTVHDYLGMTIDYSEDGKVKFMMTDYVDGILDEAPDDMDGIAVTPAASNLFTVRDNVDKLDDDRSETFHRFTAKLLYLCKRARPDLQPTVAFLTTRVAQPDTDDWNKLTRAIRYLRDSKSLYLTLEADDGIDIKWWIDASFAMHPDMRSHTGGALSFGKGSIYSMSRKQRINTKSSTEAELVGVDDGMPIVIWTRNFITAQGYKIRDNVVYQDNQSTMLLAKNGRASSGRRTRHIDIRYFFVTDRIKRGELRIEYCPTGDMVADFFTKPLQGSLFRKLRAIILNLPNRPSGADASTSQECVGKTASYADVVRGTHRNGSDVADVVRQPVVNGKK
jgi:hypothetical protein